jgi:hypothetical protein
MNEPFSQVVSIRFGSIRGFSNSSGKIAEASRHISGHLELGGSVTPSYRRTMSTVLEIERAIETLTPADFRTLAEWFDELREQRADAALEKAVLAGKFDVLAEQALRDAREGKCVSLDEFLDRA